MRLIFHDILSFFQRALRSFKQLHHLVTSNVPIALVKGKLNKYLHWTVIDISIANTVQPSYLIFPAVSSKNLYFPLDTLSESVTIAYLEPPPTQTFFIFLRSS